MSPRRFLRPIFLSVLSVVLLSFSFAPYGLFFLAWFGLVPWLVLVWECRSAKSVFLWSWLAGTLFFVANMWWMAGVSGPGMIGLTIYCGLYWAWPAFLIRGAGLLDAGVFGVIGIAAAWTGSEWLRGHVITGMPLLYLGYSQSPILAMCQVADWGGGFAVTFWVAMVNAAAAMACLRRGAIFKPIALVAAVTAFYLAYGVWRIEQTPGMLDKGPVIAVIQPNYPQSNSGQKGASLQERLDFHLQRTRDAIAAAGRRVEMVVWSETMMPPLNVEARGENPTFEEVYEILSTTAAKNHVAMLIGAEYETNFVDQVREGQDYRVALDSRNSAFFFDALGNLDPKRYDKIHLVPFGEYIPFKKSLPFLYRILLSFGPAYYSDYELQAGSSGRTDGLQPLRAAGPDLSFHGANLLRGP